MKRWEKAGWSFILTVVLAFAGTVPAFAATGINRAAGVRNASNRTDDRSTWTAADYYAAYGIEMPEPEILQADVSLSHWCAAMTAMMQEKAFALAAEEKESSIRKWEFQDMARVRTLDPVRFLVTDLTDEQAEYLKTILKMDGMKEAALPVGNLLNSDYENYAECARAVSATWDLFEGELTAEYGGVRRSPFVAFFTYNEYLEEKRFNSHIVLFTGDNEGIGACFVISSAESALNMDESYILEYASQLGLKDLAIRVYKGDELSWMMGWNEENPYPCDLPAKWDHVFFPATVRFLESLSNSRELLKLTCDLSRQGVGSTWFWTTGASQMIRYTDPGLEEARFVSGELLEGVRWEPYGDRAVMDYLNCDEEVSLDPFGKGGQPEIIQSEGWSASGNELEVLPENAKVLIVFHRYVKDVMDVTGIDWGLQAAVPFGSMPDKMEEVAYIIYCDVTYEGDSYKQGNLELMYPYSHITIHDAKTGEIVKDLGTVVRRLESFTTVVNKITYWIPLRTQTWEAIRDMFQEPGKPQKEPNAVVDQPNQPGAESNEETDKPDQPGAEPAPGEEPDESVKNAVSVLGAAFIGGLFFSFMWLFMQSR